MAKRLKVLMSAYACEPNKGSEPEVGWQWALQMAKFHDVTVLTRTNNRPAIEKELATLPPTVPVPRFVYHDESPFFLRLKKHLRAVRAYYVLWQISAWDMVERLHAEQPFDLLHHVTFAGFRYRTAIWNHGVPSVWGPVGGIESIPWNLLPWRHPISLLPEIVRNTNNVIQAAPFHVLPKRAQTTTATLVSTEEMQETFLQLGYRTILMPTIGLKTSSLPQPVRKANTGPLKILFVGNIITLKGIDLAIEALAKSNTNATFTLVGDGDYLAACKRLVTRLGLENRVEFLGRLPREQTLSLYSEFDVFLFPSLHDTGGYAVIEAMLFGLPVICLDCGGPRIAVRNGTGIRVPLASRRQVIEDLASAMREYDQDRDLILTHGNAAREVIRQDYDWDKKGLQLNAIYEQATGEKSALAPPTDSVSGSFAKLIRRMFPVQGLAISAIILFFIGTVGFLSVSHLKTDARLIVQDTLPGLSDAGNANATMAEGYNRVLLTLMAETPAERSRYRQELGSFSQRTTDSLNAYSNSIFSESDRANYNNLLERRKNYLHIREQVLTLVEEQKKEEALNICQHFLMPAYREYKTAGEKLLEYNNEQGKTRGEAILRICTGTQYVVAGIGILLFVVGFVIGLFK